MHQHMLTFSWTILKENIFLEGISLNYLRFIDDIFFILTGSRHRLTTFLNDLNTKHDAIKFEYKMSQTSIPFPARKFISKTTNYTQRFIGKKQTDKTFCILNQSILYH